MATLFLSLQLSRSLDLCMIYHYSSYSEQRRQEFLSTTSLLLV